MLQAVHLRALSFPFSHPYLYPFRRRPQVVPTSSQPSPKAVSRKPLGILLTLLNATLTRVLATVDSKRLTGLLTHLESTLTKNQGGRWGCLVSSSLLPVLCVALLISPSAKAQEKSLPPHRVSQIELYESSEELHESLLEKPSLQFG